MSALWQDFRYALLRLRRRPGFAGIVILTLAVGIAATTSIFSLVNGILLAPFPFNEPERLVVLGQSRGQGEGADGKVAPGNFASWRDQISQFEAIASAEPYGFDITEGEEPERVSGWLVSPGFFRVLGVKAQLGRTFTREEEEQADAQGSVVLSHSYWKNRRAGDPQVVGQSVLLSNGPHQIVGVMPPAFDFPPGRELWVARRFSGDDERNRTETNLTVVARLTADVSRLEQVQLDLDAVSERLALEFPTSNRGIRAVAVPIEDFLVGGVRSALIYLLLAAGLVHFIVCTNVGILFLVQGLERRNELACRVALGASNWQLIRQLLVESIVLAMVGVIPGVLLAYQGTRAANQLRVFDVPRLSEVGLDPQVVGFAVLLALITGVLCGLSPAMRLVRARTVGDLERGATSRNSTRSRQLLIALELAVVVVVLVAAGLMVRSFNRLLGTDPGFQTESVWALETHVWSRFPAPNQRETFFAQALERLATTPGVESAGAVSALPLFRGRNVRELPFFVDGRDPPPPDRQPTALHTLATNEYFQTLDIPLVRGRFFTEFDRRDSRGVALVNQALADRYWPAEDPIGQRVLVHFLGRPVLREVVGIVGDARQADLTRAARPEMFIPHRQNPFGSMTFVVRAKSSSLETFEAIKQSIRADAPGLPFGTTSTLGQMISDSMEPRRLSLRLLTVFGAMALLLAGVGVYGLVSASIRYRRREIGLRMAMGSRPADILQMLVKEGLVCIVGGLLAGGLLAVATARQLDRFLIGIEHYDPLALAGAGALVCLIGLVAILLPARSAMRVDPNTALRGR